MAGVSVSVGFGGHALGSASRVSAPRQPHEGGARASALDFSSIPMHYLGMKPECSPCVVKVKWG